MWSPDMEFVINFTPANFQAKDFTPSISPNFNSFSEKNGEIYTAGKNCTLPPAVRHGQISPLRKTNSNQ